MKPLRLATGVEEEVRAAARWYDDQRPGLGGDFTEAVEALLGDIAKAPGSYTPAGEASEVFDFRQALMRRFPYKVIFWDRPEEVFVLACAHQRRRPGFWRSRVPGP